MSRTLTCPECKFSREIPAGQIPPRAVRATCPKCGSRFSVDGGASAATPPEREIWMLAPALRRGLVLCLVLLLIVVGLTLISISKIAESLPSIWLLFVFMVVNTIWFAAFIRWRYITPLYELTPEAFTSLLYPFKIGSCRCPRETILGIVHKEQTRFGVKVRQASLVIGGRGERLREMKIDLMRSEDPDRLLQRLKEIAPPLSAAALATSGFLGEENSGEIEYNSIILSRAGIAAHSKLIPWLEVQSITSTSTVVSGYGELAVGYKSNAAVHVLKITSRTSENFIDFVRYLLHHAPQAAIDPPVARIADYPPREARQETLTLLLIALQLPAMLVFIKHYCPYAPTVTGQLFYALIAAFGGGIPLVVAVSLFAGRFYGWQPRTPQSLRWAIGACGAVLATALLLFVFTPSAWQMLQGDRAMNRGDLVVAEQHFTAALAEAPENNAARHALGLAYLEQKNYQRAFECFEKIYLSRDSLGMELIPETLLQMQRYDEALSWCDRITADHPKLRQVQQKMAEKRREILKLQKTATALLPPSN